MLISVQESMLRASTIEETPEAIAAFENQFAKVQESIHANFAGSSSNDTPPALMHQSPGRGTQLLPAQTSTHQTTPVADDATKKRYEAAKRSLSAAHGSWDRFKREVDADRPQWDSSENTAGSKLLESFTIKMEAGNGIDATVLKQEVAFKGISVNVCDIEDAETTAKEVTDKMFVLLKDIKKRRDTLNSIAKI